MSIKKAYNLWSIQYDTNENKTRELDKKATIEILSDYSFKNVLELGCGTGKNTEFLLTKAEKIIGLDFSEGMLHIATEKIKNKKVIFQQADLNVKWDVQDNYFDLITSSLTLEHIRNLDFIFEQAGLKLKHGGKFFISELHPIKQYLGSKAKFETETGTEELEVYIHHTSEYINKAEKNGFKLVKLNEFFADEAEFPRLITFVFEKEYQSKK